LALARFNFPAGFDHGSDQLWIRREIFVAFVRFYHGVHRKRTLTPVHRTIVGD
jgi:hypothetical protein